MPRAVDLDRFRVVSGKGFKLAGHDTDHDAPVGVLDELVRAHVAGLGVRPEQVVGQQRIDAATVGKSDRIARAALKGSQQGKRAAARASLRRR